MTYKKREANRPYAGIKTGCLPQVISLFTQHSLSACHGKAWAEASSPKMVRIPPPRAHPTGEKVTEGQWRAGSSVFRTGGQGSQGQGPACQHRCTGLTLGRGDPTGLGEGAWPTAKAWARGARAPQQEQPLRAATRKPEQQQGRQHRQNKNKIK